MLKYLSRIKLSHVKKAIDIFLWTMSVANTVVPIIRFVRGFIREDEQVKQLPPG